MPAYFDKTPPAPPKKRQFSSIVDRRSSSERRAAQQKLRQGSKPIPKQNTKRSKKNHARAYGGGYATWIRSLDCMSCGLPAIMGHTEAAHTTTGGMGRKADAKTLVPLCGPHPKRVPVGDGETRLIVVEGCHRFAHRVGHRKLEAVYRVNLREKAAELWRAWRKHSGAD